jgi:hypothetical protein
MNRTEYYNGGPMSPFWWYDKETAYHNKFSVTLDHEIDGEKLCIAWDKTKKVYPLIDCVPDMVNGEIVFYKDDRDNPPIKSSTPIKPGTDACAQRAFVITYSQNTIAMSSFHSVVDGGGINMIFSTLLYFYLELYTGESDEKPPVETRENRSPEEYFKPLATIDTGDFEMQPLITYKKRKDMFDDLDMTANEQGDIEIARVKVPVDKFIASCKTIGANPSSMMTILMAKAAYKLHPDKKGDIAFVLTMSARKAFEVSDSIANCSTNLLIPIEYADIMSEDISKTAKKIRAVIDYQRRSDFIKTLAAFYETYDWILAKRYAVLTYIGKLDVGKNTKHIKGFEMTDDATSSMYMMELNGEFIIAFQFGKVTKKYMKSITDILLEFDLKAEVETLPYPIMKDSDFAVLK